MGEGYVCASGGGITTAAVCQKVDSSATFRLASTRATGAENRLSAPAASYRISASWCTSASYRWPRLVLAILTTLADEARRCPPAFGRRQIFTDRDQVDVVRGTPPPPRPRSCLSRKTRMPSPRRQRRLYQGQQARCRSPPVRVRPSRGQASTSAGSPKTVRAGSMRRFSAWGWCFQPAPPLFVLAIQRSTLARSMGSVTGPSSSTTSWNARRSNALPSSRRACSRRFTISRYPVM